MNALPLVFAILSYAIGMAGLTFYILFVGGWDFMPIHIESKPQQAWLPGIFTNIGLISLFALQHTVMARPTFKEKWTQLVPASYERAMYVLLSGILMVVMCLFWQPLKGYLWQIESGLFSNIIMAIQVFGWLMAVVATFLINHFELFGLQQAYAAFKNQSATPPAFTDKFLYKLVRHPLQLGILIGLWFTPVMSSTHLSMSVLMTIYIFIGLYFEEKDLAKSIGKDYEDYQGRVPQIIPFSKIGVKKP